MDPVTAAIITALALGVAGGVKQVGEKVIVDAYNSLKAVLQRKYRVNDDLIEALDKLETKPDSDARRRMLQEEIETAKADQDDEVIAVAQVLLEHIKTHPGGEQLTQTVIGNYNQSIQSKAARDVNITLNTERAQGETIPTKRKDIDETTLELLTEISNAFSGSYFPVKLQDAFDAWELIMSDKLDDAELTRLNKLGANIERMVDGRDFRDLSRSDLRSEVKELTKIAKQPPAAYFTVV